MIYYEKESHFIKEGRITLHISNVIFLGGGQSLGGHVRIIGTWEKILPWNAIRRSMATTLSGLYQGG
jgi:hypothetical protein